jgi:hypothetical protein
MADGTSESQVLNRTDSVIPRFFSVTDGQNRFKQSSTSLLAITFIVFFAYSVVKFIYNRKTNFGLDVRIFKS